MIITGGGTAGHVTPLLAVVSELKAQHPTAKVRYIGQIGDPMSKMVKDQDTIDKGYSIFAGKWRRYHTVSLISHLGDIKTVLKNIRDAFLMLLGLLQSLFILIFWRPNVVFVKGGYVGLPVGLAAALLRIPIVTHDSDAIPGLTNRVVAKFAKFNAVGMPAEVYDKYYPKSKLRYTGVPIDPAYENIDDKARLTAKDHFGIDKESTVVAFMGGSLGAVRLNEVIIKILPELLGQKSVFVIWVTGVRQYEELTERVSVLAMDKSSLHMVDFSNEMPKIIAASDVVISRAGATVIAELAAAKKPTILVPNPILAGGHQLKNARALADLAAVEVASEQQIQANPSFLLEQINNLLSDDKLRARLGANLNQVAVSNSAAKIISVLDEATSK